MYDYFMLQHNLTIKVLCNSDIKCMPLLCNAYTITSKHFFFFFIVDMMFNNKKFAHYSKYEWKILHSMFASIYEEG